MKRFLSVALCLLSLTVLFSACSPAKTVIILTEFERQVTVIADDIKISGTLHFKNAEEIEFTVSQPEEMEGIAVSYAEGEITLKCDDLNFKISDVSSGGDIFTPLFESLKYIAESQIEAEKSGISNIGITEKGIDFVFSSDEMRIISIQKDGIKYSFQ